MSSDLQWLLLRKWNSFVVKRVPEGPVFSSEPGNLKNVHSHKFSGLANEKTIHVTQTKSGLSFTTRKTKDTHKNKVRSSRHTTDIRRSGPRRVAGILTAPAIRGYRADLRTTALARASALQAAQKEKKPVPEKKLRGKKAAEASKSS